MILGGGVVGADGVEENAPRASKMGAACAARIGSGFLGAGGNIYDYVPVRFGSVRRVLCVAKTACAFVCAAVGGKG